MTSDEASLVKQGIRMLDECFKNSSCYYNIFLKINRCVIFGCRLWKVAPEKVCVWILWISETREPRFITHLKVYNMSIITKSPEQIIRFRLSRKPEAIWFDWPSWARWTGRSRVVYRTSSRSAYALIQFTWTVRGDWQMPFYILF